MMQFVFKSTMAHFLQSYLQADRNTETSLQATGPKGRGKMYLGLHRGTMLYGSLRVRKFGECKTQAVVPDAIALSRATELVRKSVGQAKW